MEDGPPARTVPPARICEPEEILTGIPGYDPRRGYRDASDGQPVARYDHAEAVAAIKFFHEKLTLVQDWSGLPMVLERWQQAIVGNIYGWRMPNGTRRYREAFILVPRKNGKTGLAAGLVLKELESDAEGTPRIYSAAADREQAALVHDSATAMILREPTLCDHLVSLGNAKAIRNNRTRGTFRSLSADASTKHGLDARVVVVDELHAHPSRDLVDVLRTSMGARKDPLLVYITTADSWGESICNEIYDYACKVRDGVLPDVRFLPVIYEATAEDDWTSEATWRKANPNYGVSVQDEYFRREFQRAVTTPSYANAFKRLHLNIRTNAETAAFRMEDWDAGPMRRSPEALIGTACYGGLDLSHSIDLTAFALWFPSTKEALCWFWIPRDRAIQAEERDRVPYLAWAEHNGLVRFCNGNAIDPKWIEDEVLTFWKTYKPVEIGYDRAMYGRPIAQRLKSEQGLPMVEMAQGQITMSAPLLALESLVVSRQLRTAPNPCLRWNASNAMFDRGKHGLVSLDKAKSRGRVDGIAALSMAIGRAGDGGMPKGSVYETRGVRSL